MGSYYTESGFGILLPQAFTTALFSAVITHLTNTGEIVKKVIPATYKVEKAFSSKTGRPIKPRKTEITPETVSYLYKGKAYGTLEDIFLKKYYARPPVEAEDLEYCPTVILQPFIRGAKLTEGFNDMVLLHLPRHYIYLYETKRTKLPTPTSAELTTLQGFAKTLLNLSATYKLPLEKYFKNGAPELAFHTNFSYS